MATTKPTTIVWNAESFVAGTGHADSISVPLDDGYGGSIYLKIKNGVTGPTTSLQLLIEVSPDNTEWYDLGGPLDGGITNLKHTSISPSIPIGIKYIKVSSAQTNLGQNVTVECDVVEVSATS